MKNKHLLRIAIPILLALTSCATKEGSLSASSSDGALSSTSYCRVTFVNYDESFLYATNVQVGGDAIYRGPQPSHPDEEGRRYAFVGWDGELSNIQTSRTFTAQYIAEELNRYKVTFRNYDGSWLYETSVYEGQSAVYEGETPTRPDDEDGTTYRFVGWNKSTANVTENLEVIAQYESDSSTYLVRFLNFDDSVLDIDRVYRGAAARYNGPTPTRPSEAGKSYTFSGWDVDFHYVYEDLDVHALYDEETSQHKVTFYDYDGTQLYTTTVDYGSSVTYPYSDPKRGPEGRYQFTFTGWDEDLSFVDRDLEVVAVYAQTVRSASSGLSYRWYSAYLCYGVSGYSTYYYDEYYQDVYIPMYYDDGVNGKAPVRFIDSYAFQERTLNSVYIEDNVTDIRYGAFQNANIPNIHLSAKLERIENEAFNTQYLKELTIPGSLKEVQNSAFRTWDRVLKLKLAEGKEDNVHYENGCFTIIDSGTLFYANVDDVPEDLVLPDGTKTIASYAFTNCKTLKTLTIPSSMKEINYNAFASCQELTSVTIEDADVSLNNYSFGNCTKLETVDLGKGSIYLDGSVFPYSAIKELNLPAKTSFSDYNNCLSEMNNLETLTMESNTKYHVEGLCVLDKDNVICHASGGNTRTLTIPASAVSYKDYIIQNGNYNAFAVEEGNTYFAVKDGVLYGEGGKKLVRCPQSLQSLPTIRDDCMTIARYAFQNCYRSSWSGTNTWNLVLPSTVKTISSYAFQWCNAFPTITVKGSGVAIEENGFYYCYAPSLVIDGSVKTVGQYGFRYAQFTALTFPNGLESLGYEAFYNCASLTSVILPDSLTSMGNNCFQDCYALEKVTIGDGLTVIPSYAFSSCEALTTVNLGLAVERINTYAFQNCNSLKTCAFPNSLLVIQDYAFYQCYSFAPIVPTRLSEPISSSISVSSYAFYWCSCVYCESKPGKSKVSFSGVTTYYYTDSPTTSQYGNTWHYVDGVPTVWQQTQEDSSL